MSFTLGKFSFDKTTLVSLAVVLVLLGAGYGIGHVAGANNVQQQIVDTGGQQQSLIGTVKSANKGGFTLEIDKKAAGGPGLGAAGGDTPEGTWTIKYGKNGANISGGRGTGTENQELKKGDKVQVSGTPVGKRTLVAQSVTKVVPPTPAPSAAPGALKQP